MYEIITSQTDQQRTARLLSDWTAPRAWLAQDMRDELENGYFQYYRTASETTSRQVLIVQEVNQITYEHGLQKQASHLFLVSLYTGEDGDGTRGDILTTFGLNIKNQQLVVSQHVNPTLAEAWPLHAERVAGYKVYGIAGKDTAEQWRLFADALSRPDLV